MFHPLLLPLPPATAPFQARPHSPHTPDTPCCLPAVPHPGSAPLHRKAVIPPSPHHSAPPPTAFPDSLYQGDSFPAGASPSPGHAGQPQNSVFLHHKNLPSVPAALPLPQADQPPLYSRFRMPDAMHCSGCSHSTDNRAQTRDSSYPYFPLPPPAQSLCRPGRFRLLHRESFPRLSQAAVPPPHTSHILLPCTMHFYL